MSVIIAGGGIGGLALALALDRVGVAAEIHEARTEHEPSAVGAFLNLAPNGINALRELDLADEVTARGHRSTGIDFFNRHGRRVGQLDATDQIADYGAQNVMIRRADLHDALLTAVRAIGLSVTFGHRVESVSETAAGITVAFANGQDAEGSVLIGCDGVHSPTRTHVVGPQPSPKYLGLVDIAGFSRAPLAGLESGPQCMVFGRRAFFAHYLTPDGQTWWFSNVPRPDRPTRTQLAAEPTDGWLADLRAIHRDDPPEIGVILAHSDPPVGAWPTTDLAFLPRWHTARVCLLGDAAHATSPSAGQGASLAIEDAVALANHIARSGLGQNAFGGFERERRPRVEWLIKSARRNGSRKIPGPIGGWIRDWLLPLFLRLGARDANNAYGYRAEPLRTTGRRG